MIKLREVDKESRDLAEIVHLGQLLSTSPSESAVGYRIKIKIALLDIPTYVRSRLQTQLF